jgi:hypothetical protein
MSSAKYNRREEQNRPSLYLLFLKEWLAYVGSLLTVVYALTQTQIIHTYPNQLLPTTLHLPPAHTCTEPHIDKIEGAF